MALTFETINEVSNFTITTMLLKEKTLRNGLFDILFKSPFKSLTANDRSSPNQPQKANFQI